MDELPDILEISNKMDKDKKEENGKSSDKNIGNNLGGEKAILDSFVEENPDIKME